MNTFKRKALFTAVLAGLGTAGTAEAVYLNPNNTGQVLVFPYYTVQRVNNNAFNTYLSVVNTTTRAKAVKVRILEGKTSSEVLDFNLFLSPNDMWTAVIEATDGTDTSPGSIRTADVSCTNPVGRLRNTTPGSGEPFRNFVLIENVGGVGLPGTGVERTREGYVEMIEMGVLTGAWAAAVTHSDGVPEDCSVVQSNALTPSSIEAPTGGLVGTGTLINVNNGQDMTYKADALEAFRDAPAYSPPAALSPALVDASPAVSVVVNAGGLAAGAGPGLSSTAITAYRTTFIAASGVAAGARAVASVFMHTNVINEFILDPGTASNTDWVITQPLKHPYFVTNATARQPYSNVLTSSGACEGISFTFFDREERSATAGGSDFSPPGVVPASTLCWESTVLSIRNNPPPVPNNQPTDTSISGVLGSRNTRTVTVQDFQSGWANLSFTGPGATSSLVGGLGGTGERVNLTGIGPAAITGAGAVTFFGLPVTGFAVRTFANGTLTCGTGACQGNYGGLFRHSYLNLITP
jgi:hypothetical protein